MNSLVFSDDCISTLCREEYKRRTQESTMEDEKRSISKSRKIWEETEKMWGIAGPAILLSVSQYSLEFVTSAFVGHLGAFELAAVSIIHNLVQGFVYGLMDQLVVSGCILFCNLQDSTASGRL